MKLNDAILNNHVFYLLIGAVIAIALARAYVYFGGNVGIMYHGILFHHVFLGLVLVLISGLVFILFFNSLGKLYLHVFSFVFGFGAGLITDEANFIIETGQNYTLSQYYSYYNLYFDSALILILILILLISIIRKK